MKCPHCTVEFHAKTNHTVFDFESESNIAFGFLSDHCPSCGRLIVRLAKGGLDTPRDGKDGQWQKPRLDEPFDEVLVYPRVSNRSAVPVEVPDEFTEDYREACLVIADSPKASAALSRRCLQHILREKAGVKHADLAKEIQEVIDNKGLPNYIAESLDAVRNIGNFAAHPNKSASTGEIISVEPGEAEWSLDVIEMLYDFYFVQPERVKQKREALNRKLADVGKPPMKQEIT